MKALWKLAVGLSSMALLVGCGDSSVAGPATQTVTSLRTIVSTDAVTSVSTAPAADPITLTETSVETQIATETATVTETEKVTETEAADTQAAIPTDETSSAQAPAAPVKPQSLSGSGDDVVKISAVDGVAIIQFDCPGCSGNVVLETNGSEGLLVNTIGSYTGTHLINVRDDSVTSQLTITAEGSWTVSIADASTASKTLSGRGDTALFVSGTTAAAQITNSGEGNFVVEVYGSDGSDLAVNEIGSYSGTVPLSTPALVQVTSDGSWSIKPK